MFPKEWQPSYIKEKKDLEKILNSFWKTTDGGQKRAY
jgi:hypothetical protein